MNTDSKIITKDSLLIDGSVCGDCNQYERCKMNCSLFKVSKRNYNDIPKRCLKLLERLQKGETFTAEKVRNNITGCYEIKLKPIKQ